MFKTIIPPPLYLLAVGLAIYLAHHYVPSPMYPAIAIWGWLLSLMGFALVAWAGSTFRRAQTTINPFAPAKASTLVMHGPFQFTRNPMYLGFTLIVAGWAVWLNDWIDLLGIPLFAGGVTLLQIIPEEQALQRRFGEEYSRYRQRVHRWIGSRRAYGPQQYTGNE